MAKKIHDYFFPPELLEVDSEGYDTDRMTRVAVVGLLVEMSRVDSSFEQSEFSKLIEIITHEFHLMDDEAEELREMAQILLQEKSAVDDFVDIINKEFNTQQKEYLIELVSKVAKSNYKIDPLENAFIIFLKMQFELVEN